MRSLLPFLLLPAFLVFGGCAKKPGPLPAAQEFFNQIGAGQVEAAYHGAAFGFQAQRSAVVFAAAAKDMGLTEIAGAEWGKLEREGHSAKIRVDFKTRSGKDIPLIVTMVDEMGAWRVFSLRSPPSEQTGVSENRFSLVGKAPTLTTPVNQPVPPANELEQLVRATLLHFNEAIAAKSFDAFYDSVSLAWQTGSLTHGENQLTKGELQRAFQPFIDHNIDLGEIGKLAPVFDAPPAMNSEGLLILSGHYDTSSRRVQFSMKYIYELPAWKLFGLDINLLK